MVQPLFTNLASKAWHSEHSEPKLEHDSEKSFQVEIAINAFFFIVELRSHSQLLFSTHSPHFSEKKSRFNKFPSTL